MLALRIRKERYPLAGGAGAAPHAARVLLASFGRLFALLQAAVRPAPALCERSGEAARCRDRRAPSPTRPGGQPGWIPSFYMGDLPPALRSIGRAHRPAVSDLLGTLGSARTWDEK